MWGHDEVRGFVKAQSGHRGRRRDFGDALRLPDGVRPVSRHFRAADRRQPYRRKRRDSARQALRTFCVQLSICDILGSGTGSGNGSASGRRVDTLMERSLKILYEYDWGYREESAETY